MGITKVSAALANLDGGVVINESSADADFRVESNGNANMLFVDGGNDRVGIGTGSPSTNLHIYSTADNAPHLLLENFQNADTDDAPVIELYTNDQTTGGISDDTDVGVIRFTGDEKDAGGKETYAEIRGVAHDPGSGSSNKGNLSFFVQAAGDLNETLTLDEKNVGIGVASPSDELHVKGGSGSAFIRVDNSADGHDTGFNIYQNGSRKWEIHSDDSNSDALDFRPGGNQKFTMTQTGRFAIGTTSPSYTLDVNSSGNSSAFRVSNSTNGQDINCTISNSGTTAGDDSLFELATQAGAGDPKVRFSIAGNENYEIGIDNTDSDKLKISQGTALGTDDRIVIAGGSVGIGNDNPGGMHSMVNRLVVGSGSGNQGIAIWSGASNEGAIGFARSNAANSDSYDGLIEYSQADRSMRFGANAGSETMRINNGGLLIGTTNTGHDVNFGGHYIDKAGYAIHRRNSSTTLYLNRFGTEGITQQFYHAGTAVGSVSVSSDATAFNTSSDARLKNVIGDAKGLDVVNQLNPVNFEWKRTGRTQDGLIAQEVESLIPEAVSINEETDFYEMDYSKLVTPLIKAIQELSAEVEKLKQQINK